MPTNLFDRKPSRAKKNVHVALHNVPPSIHTALSCIFNTGIFYTFLPNRICTQNPFLPKKKKVDAKYLITCIKFVFFVLNILLNDLQKKS